MLENVSNSLLLVFVVKKFPEVRLVFKFLELLEFFFKAPDEWSGHIHPDEIMNIILFKLFHPWFFFFIPLLPAT